MGPGLDGLTGDGQRRPQQTLESLPSPYPGQLLTILLTFAGAVLALHTNLILSTP